MSLNTIISDRLLGKLRCVTCGKGRLLPVENALTCLDCGTHYPVRENRFPDFLTDEHRRRLDGEIGFWTKHFGGTQYGFESETSYRQWANWIGAGFENEVVELGCGSGSQLRRVQAHFRVGLEPVLSLLTATDGFMGVIGTVENLPFKDASFDIAYFSYSLHHVVDRERGMAEAARIIRPGGRLAAIEPNGAHPQRRLISNPSSPFRKLRPIAGFADPHESFFNAEELCKTAEQCQLQLEKLIYGESSYSEPSTRFKAQMIYSRLLRRILPDKYVFPSFFMSFRKKG